MFEKKLKLNVICQTVKIRSVISIVLTIALLFALTACGSNKDTASSGDNSKAAASINDTVSSDNTKSDNTSGSNDNKAQAPKASGNYKDFKKGISNFITDYMKCKKTTSDIINKSPDMSKVSLDIIGYFGADMAIAEVPMYDVLDPSSNGPKVTGKLALSGSDAFKEQSGDIIKFGTERTFDKEQGLFKAGDKTITAGSFDTSKNYLLVEDTIERGGKKVSRTVTEIVRLKDGTFNFQQISCDTRNATAGREGVFANYANDKVEAILADAEKKLDFEYKSIADSGNISADDMSKGFKPSLVIKVENGKATIDKKN